MEPDNHASVSARIRPPGSMPGRAGSDLGMPPKAPKAPKLDAGLGAGPSPIGGASGGRRDRDGRGRGIDRSGRGPFRDSTPMSKAPLVPIASASYARSSASSIASRGIGKGTFGNSQVMGNL